MQADDRTLIRVHHHWDGWRSAEVRLSDLQNVHWLQPARAPRPLLHGYVSCANLCTGEIPHDCDVAQVPHQLLVCVLKRHTPPWVYLELIRHADEAQGFHRADAQGLQMPLDGLLTLRPHAKGELRRAAHSGDSNWCRSPTP